MFMRNRCYLCNFFAKDNGLCNKHSKIYIFDKELNGFRHKKRNSGSRYVDSLYHKTEIKLTKILEDYYGPENVITSYHPIWAVTAKNVLYEYDIYITSKNILVEYNGQEHYEFTSFFHKYKIRFKRQKERDKHKARLAQENDKKLIIIKYDEPIFKDYIINKIEQPQ